MTVPFARLEGPSTFGHRRVVEHFLFERGEHWRCRTVWPFCRSTTSDRAAFHRFVAHPLQRVQRRAVHPKPALDRAAEPFVERFLRNAGNHGKCHVRGNVLVSFV